VSVFLSPIFNTTKEMSEEVDSMSEGEMRANGKRSQAKERENPKAKLIALDAESWANIVDTDKDWDVPEEGRPSSSASSAKGAKAKNVAPGEKKRSKGRSRASSKEASRAKEVQTIHGRRRLEVFRALHSAKAAHDWSRWSIGACASSRLGIQSSSQADHLCRTHGALCAIWCPDMVCQYDAASCGQ